MCKCLEIHHSVYYYHCNHQENSYKIANQNGYNIEDPGNITLTFQMGYDTNYKIGVFPFVDWEVLSTRGKFVKRT